jgi:hypothetical protein
MSSPCLLYHCWKDAKREVKNSPNNGGGGCAAIAIIGLVVMLGGGLIFSGSMEGALIGIALIIGLVKGFQDMQ